MRSKAGEHNELISPPAESVPGLNNREIVPISSPHRIRVEHQTTLASPLGSELVGVIGLTPSSGCELWLLLLLHVWPEPGRAWTGTTSQCDKLKLPNVWSAPNQWLFVPLTCTALLHSDSLASPPSWHQSTLPTTGSSTSVLILSLFFCNHDPCIWLINVGVNIQLIREALILSYIF